MLENLVQTNLHFQPENSSPVKEKNFGLEENLNLVFTKNDSLTCNINKSSFPTNNFNLVDQKQPTSLFNSADFCLTSNPTILTDKKEASEAVSISKLSAPAQDLLETGKKFNVPFNEGDSMQNYQHKVIKAVITAKAKTYKIPLKIALGVSGHESSFQMWDKIESKSPSLVAGKNIIIKNKKRVTLSTDWGAMQINDKAHKEAFPKAKQDLEYNIEFGLRYLADVRREAKGNLGYGLGDWDNTIAAYNLGHKPAKAVEYVIAKRYVNAVSQKGAKAAKT